MVQVIALRTAAGLLDPHILDGLSILVIGSRFTLLAAFATAGGHELPSD